MRILVYSGEGVGRKSFKQTFKALREVLSDEHILQEVNHRFFLETDWEKTAALVVFPGGRDEPYHARLRGEANFRLRKFVENGGAFFGICAGGYYGAAEIEFEKGGKLEVTGERELKFFPGKAIGPAYGNGHFQYDSETGSREAKIDWVQGSSSVYFNGGCFFEHAEHYENTEIIARYSDIQEKPAAIIKCQVGHGKALLSGVHPEWGNFLLEPNEDARMENEPNRKFFFKFLLSLLI